MCLKLLLSFILMTNYAFASVDLFVDETTTDTGTVETLARKRIELASSKEHLIDHGVHTLDSEKINFAKSIPAEINLNTFITEYWTAYHTKTVHHENGRITWIGKVYGDENSMITLTQYKENLAGEVSAFGKILTIKPVGTSLTLLQEKNDAFFKEEGGNDTLSVSAKSFKNKIVPSSLVSTDGTVIDLLVVYTTAASAASSDIVTEITDDISSINVAYDRSCTQTSFRLVGTSQVSYTESGDGDVDLACLMSTTDGCIDNVHTLRDSLGADLVQIWIEGVPISSSNSVSICGLAYSGLPNPIAAIGFSLKVRSCDYTTTAHELGHQFNVQHDRYQCGTSTQANMPYNAGYGFVNLRHKVRDIMSYGSECTANGFTCDRLPYFSNPKILIKGEPFGYPNLTDAVSKIKANRTLLASYRTAVSEPSNPSFSSCKEIVESKKKMGCFIATATYGSELASQVVVLRIFRDKILKKIPGGNSFINFYYQYSPYVSSYIKASPSLNTIIKDYLTLLLFFVKLIL